MKISENGLNLIKSFEGCRLTAYKDSVGVWTIGYGTTNADRSITGTAIVSGLKINHATADEWLKKSVDVKYGPKVEKYNDIYIWNQNEYDALVSFAYNIGSIDQLTANGTRKRSTIAKKILQYNKAGGKVLTGLTRRRESERTLFLTPVQEQKEGWVHDENGWWWRNADGTYPKMCWKTINHHRYLFGNSGYMLSGWVQWDGKKTGAGKWYYLEEKGDFQGACWHGTGDNGSLERWYID